METEPVPDYVHWVVCGTYCWDVADFHSACRIISILTKTQSNGMLLYYQLLPQGMKPANERKTK